MGGVAARGEAAPENASPSPPWPKTDLPQILIAPMPRPTPPPARPAPSPRRLAWGGITALAACLAAGCGGQEQPSVPVPDPPVVWEATGVTVDGTPIAEAEAVAGQTFTVAGILARVGEEGPEKTFPGIASVTASTGSGLNVGSGLVREVGPGGEFKAEVGGVSKPGRFDLTLRSAGGRAEAEDVRLGKLAVTKS